MPQQLEKLGIGDRPPCSIQSPTPTNSGGLPKIAPRNCFPSEDLPGSWLFEEFCSDTIKRWQLGDRVIKAKVTRIQPKSARFRLWFEDGKSAIARRVIVVTGSGKPPLPGRANQIQTQHPAERIRHSHQLDLRNL